MVIVSIPILQMRKFRPGKISYLPEAIDLEVAELGLEMGQPDSRVCFSTLPSSISGSAVESPSLPQCLAPRDRLGKC